MKVAELFVKCLEEEGVEYIFGLPGEENIDLMDALVGSKIRFILVRHEQAASFMADIYGRLAGKAGVCLATLGPGAINLTLGAADAQLDSAPLVAIAGQAKTDRIFKEFHQYVDLVKLFEPITKWAAQVVIPDTAAEIIRKAFKIAQMARCGATLVVLPEDIAKQPTSAVPLPKAQPKPEAPHEGQLLRAAKAIIEARNPVILAGHGVCRSKASEALTVFAEHLKIPVATTFMAKGVIPDSHPCHCGAIGFMRPDYANRCIAEADLVICVGYDLIEYEPGRWNPAHDKGIIHISRCSAEVDSAYCLTVGIEGDIGMILNRLRHMLPESTTEDTRSQCYREMFSAELESYAADASFPLKPQRIISDLRRALGDDDIILCDTGALKMWMARLFPCRRPDTCLFSNGLGTMGFSVPGALAAKLIYPDRKIIAVTGDGSFMMNSQELETARREGLPFVTLIWTDGKYGLIKWKQELEFGRSSFISFTNPDFKMYAESFGCAGYRIEAADQLLPTLEEAFRQPVPAIIECPVDYSENIRLTDKLADFNRQPPRS